MAVDNISKEDIKRVLEDMIDATIHRYHNETKVREKKLALERINTIKNIATLLGVPLK
jgi:hypothetical protein